MNDELHAPILRDGQTIRAYLEELARLQTPVQFWHGSDIAPFETTLAVVSPITFSTTTTPHLVPGQILDFAFMLDARRFISQGKVVTPGVFRIPLWVALGERRSQFRGPIQATELVTAMAAEVCAGSVLGGRTLLGRVLNLSPAGFRLALEDAGALSGPGGGLKPGDRFDAICISGLPLTPTIPCRGAVAHLGPHGPEPTIGFRLEGLEELDRKNIERILIPRLPATFGETFPTRKRKTDLADRQGPPTLTQVRIRAPELLGAAPGGPAPVREEDGKAAPNALVQLRKAGKKILILSALAATADLADGLRQDGFKQLHLARTLPEAKALAEKIRFDLLMLDMRVGGLWAKDIMEALAADGLLRDARLVLVVDHRNEAVAALARDLSAAHLHERSRDWEDLIGVVSRLLLD